MIPSHVHRHDWKVCICCEFFEFLQDWLMDYWGLQMNFYKKHTSHRPGMNNETSCFIRFKEIFAYLQ